MSPLPPFPITVPGIYPDVDHDAYLASPGLSASRLKRFARAPAYAFGAPGQETQAIRRGTLTHCAVLEPHAMEARFAPTALDRRGTKAWAAEEEAASGRELVKQTEWDQAREMRDAVLAHPIAAALLDGAHQVEQSFAWDDPETGIFCRSRADIVHQGMNVLADVKTCQDASPRAFAKAVAEYRYDWAAAFYSWGYPLAGGFHPDAFIFLAIEPAAPYLVAAYELAPTDLQLAAEQVRRHMDYYAECERADYWPGYDTALITLEMPTWAAFR